MNKVTHAQILQSLLSAASQAEHVGDLRQSEVLLERGLMIAARAYGENTSQFANVLIQLADIAAAQCNWGKAQDCYLRAIGILKRICGDNHSSVGIGYHNLSEIFQEQGYNNEATLYAGLAAQIMRQQLSADKRDMAS